MEYRVAEDRKEQEAETSVGRWVDGSICGGGGSFNLPVVVPSRPDLSHPVLPVRVIGLRPPRVPERAAPDRVDADEQDEHHDVEHRDLVPVVPDVLQHPGLARVALVAQHRRGVVPLVAVGILGRRHHRRVVRAGSRRLTAARLITKQTNIIRRSWEERLPCQEHIIVASYLNRRHIPLQVIERAPWGDLGAGAGPDDTVPDGAPVLRVLDSIPEPGGVVGEPVLPVVPPWDIDAAAGARDHEAEDGEPQESGDEAQHDHQVDPQGPGHVETGADESRQGNHQDHKADDEQRRPQEVLAGRAALRHPQARPDYRYWCQEREEV